MTTRTSVLKRLAAGVGVFALAIAGLLASGTAHADDTIPPPAAIDGDAKGSLTITKYTEHEDSEAGQPAGDPLEKVTFTVQEVYYDGARIDLTSAEGWVIAEGLFDAAPALPPGYTLVSPGTSVETDEDGVAPFPDLEVAVYWVTETASSGQIITTPAAPFPVAIPQPGDGGTWDYHVIAYPKNVLDELDVTKTALTPETGTPLEIEVGADIDWEIAAAIPASAFAYESLKVEDLLPTSLEFVGWKSISIGATVLDSATDYNVDPETHAVTLTPAGLAKVNQNHSEVQTLTAVITTKVLSVGIHENTAKVTLNGQPDDGSGTSNWGAAKLAKVSSAGGSLEGAVFHLYRATEAGQCEVDEDLLIAEKTTNSTGVASWEFFIGNDDVTTLTVCLWEETAPAGHVLPTDQWVGGPSVVTANTEGTAFDFGTITNHKPEGPTLPETGAQGTWAMTVGGFLLIAGAATTLIVRRRKATH